ncbi:hypothetical protein [Quisquiliibacterium transsilvanicum]|uniref:Uncharacterized protein n=1 Tax=Quisquiliibacterium transsilvanicum TaxID=1549638 RepID=A0A7W8HF26_9BURK|nr:hypothetical protein [Quisquiliibacterium transsilvanicum]MBB5270815.1 hypothetical protein [Quisquiliibacterium transsilvanicum]
MKRLVSPAGCVEGGSRGRLRLKLLAAGLTMMSAAACVDRPSPDAPAAFGDARQAAPDRAAPPAGGMPGPTLAGSMLQNLAAAGPALPGVAGRLGLYDLELVGEIELDGDRVERSYRATLVNRGAPFGGAELLLRDAGPRIEIVSGSLRVVALGPEERASPAETLVLRHPSKQPIDPERLRWELRETDDSEGPAGALLRGDPKEPAAAALRGFTAGAPPAFSAQPLQIEAVLVQAATVGQVNDALRRTATRIAGMRPHNRMLTLRMEAGTGVASMQQRLEQLQASGAFEMLRPVLAPSSGPAGRGTGPGELPPPDPEPDFADHRDV